MSKEQQAAAFREAVAQAGPRGRTTAYPRALRAKALAYLRGPAGARYAKAARDLGIDVDTLRRWEKLANERPIAFRKVSVVAEPAGSSHVVVHAPGGVRIEGLGVADVAELLRKLA